MNNTSNKKIFSIKYIQWIIAGIFFLGTLFDAISNSIQLISPALSKILISIIVIQTIIANLYIYFNPITYTNSKGNKLVLKKIGPKIHFWVAGVIICLSFPLFAPKPIDNALTLDIPEAFEISSFISFSNLRNLPDFSSQAQKVAEEKCISRFGKHNKKWFDVYFQSSMNSLCNDWLHSYFSHISFNIIFLNDESEEIFRINDKIEMLPIAERTITLNDSYVSVHLNDKYPEFKWEPLEKYGKPKVLYIKVNNYSISKFEYYKVITTLDELCLSNVRAFCMLHFREANDNKFYPTFGAKLKNITLLTPIGLELYGSDKVESEKNEIANFKDKNFCNFKIIEN